MSGPVLPSPSGDDDLAPPDAALADAAGWHDAAVLALAAVAVRHTTAAGRPRLRELVEPSLLASPESARPAGARWALPARPTGPASRLRADLVLEVVCSGALLAALPIHRTQLLRELRGAQRRQRTGSPDRACRPGEQRRTARALAAAAAGVALVAADPDAALRQLLSAALSAVAQQSLAGREPRSA